METRVEELEKKIGVVQTKLQKVMSRLDKLDLVDFEKLNGAMEHLLMIEDGLMNILRHLNISNHRTTTPSVEPVPKISNIALTVGEIDKGKAILEEQPTVEGETTDPPFMLNRQDTLPRKLELPIFEGNNPDGWLIRVELNGVSPAEILRATVVCLEGDALALYYYEESRRTFQGWPSRNYYQSASVHLISEI